MTRIRRGIALALALLITACGSAPAERVPPPATTGPASAAGAPAGQPKASWPREVQTPRGAVIIQQKPQRIHTLSLGLDEITLALVDPSRVAAVGKPTVNPDWSNVADLAAKVPKQIARDAEQVLAVAPDLVVSDPYSKEDLVKAIESGGVPVVVANQIAADRGHEENIRLLAYFYGEEERGEQLIAQVRERLAKVDAVVGKKSAAERPRVLMLIGNNYTPGEGSNEDGIIRRAGGTNVATEAGIKGNKQVSLEAIPGMRPDLILIVEQDSSKPVTQNAVLGNPALQDLPAIKQKRYFLVKHSYVTTLSHWTVRGVEDLAKIFYPSDFK